MGNAIRATFRKCCGCLCDTARPDDQLNARITLQSVEVSTTRAHKKTVTLSCDTGLFPDYYVTVDYGQRKVMTVFPGRRQRDNNSEDALAEFRAHSATPVESRQQ
jgi:hypothetical protein